MKILIIGASGKTGQILLAQLKHTNHAVTGLIRSAAQEDQIKQFGAAALIGSLEDDITDALKNFDTIIFVAGSRGKNVQGIDYQGLVNTVDAAIKVNISRFLYIGSINVGKPPEQFIQEIKDFYQANHEPVPEGLLKTAQNPKYHTYIKIKTLAEKHIIHSGINYTILRAGLLTEEPGSGKVSITENTLNAFGKISRENVAACFIAALENENTYQKTYTLLDGQTPIGQAFNIYNIENSEI